VLSITEIDNRLESVGVPPATISYAQYLSVKNNMGHAYSQYNPANSEYALGFHANPEKFPNTQDNLYVYSDPLFTTSSPELLSQKWCSPEDPTIPAVFADVPSSFAFTGTPPLTGAPSQFVTVWVPTIVTVGIIVCCIAGFVVKGCISNGGGDYQLW